MTITKEQWQEIDRWLLILKETLSKKTTEKEIEELQRFIDVYEWLREQAFAVYGGETFIGYREQTSRYRKARKIIETRYDIGRMGGVSDGLMLAMEIIDKTLEGEE